MRITKVNIKKFRQLENVVEENIGLINELYGSNGSGKTSFISFITWLLYGETLDYGKNDDMNIDTFKPYELISGEIELEDGTTLARDFGYNESGKKTQDFFVNGRKVKKQDEYFNKVYECFGLESLSNLKIKNFNLLKAMSDPYYLPNNEAQFRELINVLLNFEPYEVLFEQEKYKDIQNDYYYQGYNYDNCKDFYNQKLKKIESDLLIANNIINECKGVTFDENKYRELKEELNKVISAKVETMQELVVATQKLNDLQLQIIESRKNDYVNPKLSDEEIELKDLKSKYNLLCDEYNNKHRENSFAQMRIKTVKEEKETLLADLERVRTSTFKEVKCPNCDCLVNEEDYKAFNKNKVETTKNIKERINELDGFLTECVIVDLEHYEKDLETLLSKINALKEIINSKTINNTSEQTKALETEYNELYEQVLTLREQDLKRQQEITQENHNKRLEIEQKISTLEFNKMKLDNLEVYKNEKQRLLDEKSVYELKLSLLNEFKIDEINLIKSKTTEIFGNDFEFEMLVKNKSNDNYKKVCYASIDGLEHNKSNTAKYLTLSIMLLEKLKAYIGGCTIPIVFDIADNIGKQARETIFKLINNSQIFYTRIADEVGVERTLNVIEKEK